MSRARTSLLVRSYTVTSTAFSDYSKTVVARSSGAAKYRGWLVLSELYSGVPYTSMRAQVCSGFVEPPGFRRNAEYRQIPFVTVGMRVRMDDGLEGVIVGHNSSANLEVLFDNVSFPQNCHPAWQISYLVDGAWRRSPLALPNGVSNSDSSSQAT